MLRKLAFGLAFAGLTLAVTSAEAARVTPMVVDIAPTGSKSITRIEVTNNEDKQVPLEVRMYRGEIGERGELDLKPADEEFLVFPPQAVMAARSQQVFRVQYLPGQPLTESQVYYAAISQVPVPLDNSKSKIQVVMRFNVLVNVVPPGTKADPAVVSIEPVKRERTLPPETPAPGEAGQVKDKLAKDKQAPRTVTENGIEVRIENKGTRYFAAGRSDWKIAGTTENGAPFGQYYTESQISELVGMGIVAPGKARIFFIPTETPLKAGSTTVTLKY